MGQKLETFHGGHYYFDRYTHIDNDPEFGDFSPFGGWSYPNIKQYAGDISVCGKI